MRRKIMVIAFILSLASVYAIAQDDFVSSNQAKQHAIVNKNPAPGFFEGALMGNGGMGVVVCTRPDAVVLRFGHNDVWDIRISEDNKDKIGTFEEIFQKVKSIDPSLKHLEDDPWYARYKRVARSNYAKPYPRPFPCGSLVLGFDRREVELIGHKLDISNGLVRVQLLIDGETAYLNLFTDMEQDRVWMKLVNDQGMPIPGCFDRINLFPDRETPPGFPEYEVNNLDKTISFKQVLPYQEPGEYDKEAGHPKDEAFALSVVTSCDLEKRQRVNRYGNMADMEVMEYAMVEDDEPFWACVELRNGLAIELDEDYTAFESLGMTDVDQRYTFNNQSWSEYWAQSGLNLEDKELESIWYRNLYFFRCAAKSGVSCPGLFANWSFNDIGTAWHGDWHMNYNTQQPFWATLTSNHPELNLPYVEMVEFISEVAGKWAKDYYDMRGTFYPHSAYPVEMTMNPYPVPDWGWEVFETPWAVQGVWWHYLYTGDSEFLRNRAFPLIRDAVLFIVDYMTRPEAHGEEWGDDKYHVFPTVPPELYKLRPGFQYNSDGLVDLTLIKFLFKAYLRSVDILDLESEKETVSSVQNILNHYPEYPTETSEQYGEVFVSVDGESTEMVYNAPCNLMTVFPGEDHGLHSNEEIMSILANTKKNNQNEGGNELVFQHLQAARIGMLDLDRFKRAVRYCTLENGTSANLVLQEGGRYTDHTDFNFMKEMGIWFENFGLPAVINECLLQSYNGIIRLYPNWPGDQDAQFKTLRAAGGFLVSSSIKNGHVQEVEIFCENTGELKLYNPWGTNSDVKVWIDDAEKPTLSGPIIQLKVQEGQRVLLTQSLH
ncbi:MAG: glycosyl hydrolase family 95 catalytic domain-containing protein [Bacteroidota bacterium]